MDSFPEHYPKQASHIMPTKPTVEETKEWDDDELLRWIHQKRPKLLEDDHREKLKTARISGEAFLECAGDIGFFQNACKLPPGTSVILAKLAREIMVGEETAGMVLKGKEQGTSTGKSTRLCYSLYANPYYCRP